MCRICGRTIKCIFDSMPSRTLIQHTSRRAFTTYRAQSTRPILPSSRPPTSPSALAASFCTLRLSSSTSTVQRTALSTTLRPSLSFTPTTRTTSLARPAPATARSFSTTPITLGKRRRMDTYSPSRRVQKRRHGFLARQRTANGRKTLKNRRLRGRKALSW